MVSDLRADWIYRFSDCPKTFIKKESLKKYQNRYYAKEIEVFNSKLASIVDGNVLSEEEKDIACHLAKVYNSAKGIKGRGKGLYSFFYGLSNPAAYSMNWPPPTAILWGYSGPPLSFNTQDTAYAHYHHYDAYADYSDASSVHGPMPVPYIYKEEHGQDLAFGDRLY
ncbi:hypothetical protein C8A01DRAFT_40706 [Parachaetomium inaequale]|uniref:Uncharacterized protein n=1 Tax=Parachaetomium inaequale TaxID=2588326 RepID=A0AAN6PBB2_9PEZI|nr:hypothetical protein C8A01DRAFT_40706 [Parachaetomium inaequale]